MDYNYIRQQLEMMGAKFTSHEGSCIIFNALTRNGDPHDDNDVFLLLNFRGMLPSERVTEYYVRSCAIVKKLNEQAVDQSKWAEITVNYVRPLLNEIRNNNLDGALENLSIMLNDLEVE